MVEGGGKAQTRREARGGREGREGDKDGRREGWKDGRKELQEGNVMKRRASRGGYQKEGVTWREAEGGNRMQTIKKNINRNKIK